MLIKRHFVFLESGNWDLKRVLGWLNGPFDHLGCLKMAVWY